MKILYPLLLICCLSVIPAEAQDYLLQSVKKHGRVNAVKFSPDGSQILSGGDDRTSKLWDASTGKDVLILTGHYTNVQTVAFNTPSNQYMASSGNVVLLYDNTGRILTTFRGHNTTIWTLSLHPSYLGFATGSFEKTIRLWEFDKPRFIAQLEGHEENNLAVAFNPDGSLLVSGSLDETIRVWDYQSRETIQLLRGHSGNILSLAFSRDGKFMASGSSDQTIRVWDTETWECLHILSGHEKGVYALVFSNDNHLLLSASADHTIQLWQVINGDHLFTFNGHSEPVVALDIHPIENTFLSGSLDGTIGIWDLNTEIIVNHYYAEEIKAETEQSELSGPRNSDESRADYRRRQEQLDIFKKELLSKYYLKYKEVIAKKL